MRSPGLAIGWELGQRHRWGLVALAGYWLALGAIKLLWIGPGRPIDLDDSGTAAAVAIVPVATTFMYFLGVFSFGFSGDLAARRSMYPARMFTLPVSTAALAGWPILYGAVAMMTLWLTTTCILRWEIGGGLGRFVLQPWGIEAPLVWPAVLGAAFLAWTQVLTWMPYGLRGLRVIVTILWLGTFDAAVFLAVTSEVPEPLLVAFLALQLPLAYGAACFAVARARRGEVPDWGIFARKEQAARVLLRRRDFFRSPARAQLWFEWRQHGWSLPALVGILLPFELVLLFVFSDAPAIVLATLLGVLLTPPFMARFVAATVSRGMTPFLATRPSTGAAQIAAKLVATLLSTLAAWLLVLVAIPVALALSGTVPVVVERAHSLIEAVGTPRGVVLGLLLLTGLLASTWKQLVQSLCIGLTGREWVVKASVLVALAAFGIVVPLSFWIYDHGEVHAGLLNALPSILAVLACCKTSAAVFIATRLHDRRLLGNRTLVTFAAGWLLVVLGLYALLVWLFATPFVASYFLLLVAILQIPLVRLSAAPLALAWSRHQ